MSDPVAGNDMHTMSDPAAGDEPRGLRGWIIHHDDRWLFIVPYVGLAVFLSIWISLFWLVAVVAVHGIFEWVRQRHLDPAMPGLLGRVGWALKLDLALIAFALALALYMDFILGVAGLGGAARMGAQGGARVARVAGWSRALRGLLLSLDDIGQVSRAAAARLARRKKPAQDEPRREDADAGALRPWRRWSVGDHIAIWLGLLCVLAILLAPVLLDRHSWPSVGATILNELNPWPD